MSAVTTLLLRSVGKKKTNYFAFCAPLGWAVKIGSREADELLTGRIGADSVRVCGQYGDGGALCSKVATPNVSAERARAASTPYPTCRYRSDPIVVDKFSTPVVSGRRGSHVTLMPIVGTSRCGHQDAAVRGNPGLRARALAARESNGRIAR